VPDLAAIEALTLDGLSKGLPPGIAPLRLKDVGAQGWNVLAQDLPLPLAVLKETALRHNGAWMRRFLGATGARLSPHGKTSMSPQLFARQLDDGAWAITVATVQQGISMTTIGTRQAAATWIRRHVPPGATIVKESYTPDFDEDEFVVLQGRFAARRSLEEIRDPSNDYLLLAWNAYGRFTRPENLSKPHHHLYAERYAEILEWEKVEDWLPGATRRGPGLELYRLRPVEPPDGEGRRFAARDVAFLHGVERREGGSLRWRDPGAWALFKTPLDAGRYRLRRASSAPTTSSNMLAGSGTNAMLDHAAVELPDVPLNAW